MKVLMVKFLLKVAVPLLMGIQVLSVSAGENNTNPGEQFKAELIREMKENIRLPELEKQKLEVKIDRQKISKPEKKTVGYVSIISLIVNDAFGHSNRKIRVRSFNEAGKINF